MSVCESFFLLSVYNFSFFIFSSHYFSISFSFLFFFLSFSVLFPKSHGLAENGHRAAFCHQFFLDLLMKKKFFRRFFVSVFSWWVSFGKSPSQAYPLFVIYRTDLKVFFRFWLWFLNFRISYILFLNKKKTLSYFSRLLLVKDLDFFEIAFPEGLFETLTKIVYGVKITREKKMALDLPKRLNFFFYD